MFSTRKRRAGVALALTTSAAIALTGCSGGGGSEPAATFDPEEEVTLDLAFWGNDVRADFYNQAIAAFNEEYPNITVNTSFLAFPEFWEARQVEAAGGNLPDVMQFDYSYLRQYSENGLLLPLDDYMGGIIETDGLAQNILDIGVVNDQTTAIATSTNAWGLYTNPILAQEVGASVYEGGGSWEDYNDYMIEATQAAGDSGVYGGTDWTGRIQNFELHLRAQGENLFTEEGEPNFTQEDVAEFFDLGTEVREQGGVVPGQLLEELYPVSAFDSARSLSELTWDNFGAGYLGNLGEPYTELGLVEPPTAEEGSQDLYLKPSMLHAISANTDHPEAAATLVNFLINDPQVSQIFGTNRGIPASETQLESLSLEGLDAQIREYEQSIEDRLGDAPPVPIVGYGAIEEEWRQIGTELGLGTITPEAAAERFFTEMEVILNS
ncbi:ABC transporter substrate-binding protein [Desertivibrio insolitus]|uniref:ABC transporter substrate-binding protein n=1 Tax=Herbiconiux sp. SYSU D00978 TaxID=2812562 RepID=UPI001A9627BF|nr:extracellular solute-binding protein [Herbiconiux sp. SYSU D00978]